jgi:hypothetical protein
MVNRLYLRLGVGLTLVFAFDMFLRTTLYLYYIDWPARPAAMPAQLQYLTRDDPSLVTNVYVHDLGGFIDSEYLWKIEGQPALVDVLVKKLELQAVRDADEIPSGIWKQRPYWWNPRQAAGVRYFKSPGFVADERGVDGDHHFLIHDEEAGLFYVWLKANF